MNDETPGAPETEHPAQSPGRLSQGTRRAGAAFALAGLLVGGLAGARVHDALAARAADQTGSLAAPTAPPLAPQLPVLPNIPQQGGGGQATAGVAAKVTPSVVDIYTTLPGGSGAGTGMILTSSGDVLTNNHVVQGATSIRVIQVTTGRSYSAKVLGTDSTNDVAVLRLNGASGLTPISAGDSSAVTIGQPVVALGNAGGRGGAPSVVSGSVVATNRSITVGDTTGGPTQRLSGLIQTDAPIQPGDSGGPLVSTDAKVLGMDTAASVGNGRVAASEGYAIPINKALAIARQIQEGRPSSTVRIGVPGMLGVSVVPASLSLGTGAQVAGVAAGSPAAGAGLMPGDTITTVDGRPVASATALTTMIRSHSPGDRVRIGWVTASGTQRSATVTLIPGPPA